MDDPNLKMKNIYSSVSSSEIALRCTILDLCQRLKRTEVLCDYYEQCRNELVSDCIRLRQERDYYLMAHEINLQKSEAATPKMNSANINTSNANKTKPSEATSTSNQLNHSNNKKQSNFAFEKEIDFPKTVESESYEEIARRLITQFRKEMEEIKRASINGQQKPTLSNQNETVPSDCQVLKGYGKCVDQIQQGPSSLESQQYINLCNNLLKTGINDFDTLTRMLMNQNEKLRKLKGKQLRNYFKRQLEQNTM